MGTFGKAMNIRTYEDANRVLYNLRDVMKASGYDGGQWVEAFEGYSHTRKKPAELLSQDKIEYVEFPHSRGSKPSATCDLDTTIEVLRLIGGRDTNMIAHALLSKKSDYRDLLYVSSCNSETTDANCTPTDTIQPEDAAKCIPVDTIHKRGKWIVCCSVCGFSVNYKTNICPNCGLEMDV